MNEKYLPKTLNGRLVHLVEECSEVIKEICKAQRFGLNGDADWIDAGEMPPKKRILNEIADVRRACDLVEADLKRSPEGET